MEARSARAWVESDNKQVRRVVLRTFERYSYWTVCWAFGVARTAGTARAVAVGISDSCILSCVKACTAHSTFRASVHSSVCGSSGITMARFGAALFGRGSICGSGPHLLAASRGCSGARSPGGWAHPVRLMLKNIFKAFSTAAQPLERRPACGWGLENLHAAGSHNRGDRWPCAHLRQARLDSMTMMIYFRSIFRLLEAFNARFDKKQWCASECDESENVVRARSRRSTFGAEPSLFGFSIVSHPCKKAHECEPLGFRVRSSPLVLHAMLPSRLTDANFNALRICRSLLYQKNQHISDAL